MPPGGLIPRDPKAETRTRRALGGLAGIINSLIENGSLLLVGPGKYILNPAVINQGAVPVLFGDRDVDEAPMVIPGPPGANGTSGSNGPPGPALFMLEAGPQGDEGFPVPGIPGPSGASGAGLPGAMGPVGVPLEDGPQGDEGVPIPGPQGAQGLQGIAGLQGQIGVPFEDGPQGDDGVPIPGPQGIQGVQGIAGSQGAQGQVGVPFEDGPQGDDGVPIPGPQGIQGTQGIQGQTGAALSLLESGPPGDDAIPIPGPQGAQGAPGVSGSTVYIIVAMEDGPQGEEGLPGIGTPVSSTAIVAPPATVPSGRLTLTSTLPVTTADVTGASVVYYTPYTGYTIVIFTAGAWTQYQFTELSVAVPASITAVLPYDVFINDTGGGVLALSTVGWASTTARATAITRQDGRYVKGGANTFLYLGTFCTTASAVTEDSHSNRYVWNMYNRRPRSMYVNETTSSWTYNVAAWRAANANNANRVNFVIGSPEDSVTARVNGMTNAAGTSGTAANGIGLDSTTTNAAQILGGVASLGQFSTMNAFYTGAPAVGQHFLQWVEFSSAAATLVTTWYGHLTAGVVDFGLSGEVWA